MTNLSCIKILNYANMETREIYSNAILTEKGGKRTTVYNNSEGNEKSHIYVLYNICT